MTDLNRVLNRSRRESNLEYQVFKLKKEIKKNKLIKVNGLEPINLEGVATGDTILNRLFAPKNQVDDQGFQITYCKY